MPTYEYECTNKKCKHQLEVYQGFNDAVLEVCPKCGKKKLKKLISGGLGFYMSGRTVGAVADKNSSAFSSDFKEHLKNKNKTKKVDTLSAKLGDKAKIEKPPENKTLPWYKKDQKVSDKALQNATPAQQEKYITEGKLE